ncbi:DEAD/DEAH box helicase family protein [Enterococcus gallinarum]|nr:DEAD/DEAH box helicase family protein [Enterococcus gallinarum]
MEEGGREILVSERERNNSDQLKGDIRPAVLIKEGQIECQRCGSCFNKEEVQLPTGIHYCPACIHYGRADTSKVFVTVSEQSSVSFPKIHWPGPLTVFQKRISQALVRNYQQKKATLVWSVTGSGKTEMIFEVIQAARLQGHRVAVVSPRIDVCRELFPRIQQAFPKES